MATAVESLQRIWRVRGQVQGVGFRPFVHRLATELDLAGSVRNDASGVIVSARGPAERLDRFARRLADDAPALSSVEAIECVEERRAAAAPRGFWIEASDDAPLERGRVTVDAAVCEDCLREMRDPADRRHGHPLVNCTSCGPRYTIVTDLPYDRPRTTMAGFAMCDACAGEYGDPSDRRFHAQPVCCPDCGPRLTLLDGEGSAVDADPVTAAAEMLRAGRIVAVKGLGGYHLALDARSEEAVRELRRRKRRDAKPLALMVPDLEAARELASLSAGAEDALMSPAAPIVIAPRRDRDLAPSVAEGHHRLGIMLPYTPLQHLLFDQGLGPLVMTSANVTDDPLVKDDEEALRRLSGIADAFLVHDRPIERAVDDSILIDGPRGLLPVRRARGYAPAPLPLPVAAERPGLAVGGELKGTVAVARGDGAVVSQHLGDLSWALAWRRFSRTVEDLLRLFEVEPAWIACDAHPDYLSHRYARRRAAEGPDLVVVQHHHAHLASLLAEHGRDDRIVGLVCDGVGYGADGGIWGGEVLAADLAGFTRLGRLRPLLLPGGDAAARETRRCASSWLFDALGPEAVRDHAHRTMLEGRINTPESSGAGRLFDAAASLLGLCDENLYEAMSGMRLEAAASRAVERPTGDGLVPLGEDGDLLEMDHRPLLRTLVEGIERGDATESLAWLFHDALADGLARAARRAAEAEGLETVGLSGGVFCNAILTELTAGRLAEAGLETLLHRRVPPNDGGIAYGQAAVAAATR
ncbi:MAG: carbamoyltransferase HypF [Planctomycetota bacterium]|jgi:hydrogenase maturation protein HypF